MPAIMKNGVRLIPADFRLVLFCLIFAINSLGFTMVRHYNISVQFTPSQIYVQTLIGPDVLERTSMDTLRVPFLATLS